MKLLLEEIKRIKKAKLHYDTDIKSLLVHYLESRDIVIPKDILFHSFISHHVSEELFEEFSYIDLTKYKLSTVKLNNDEILDIEYADFVSEGIKTEYDWYNSIDLKYYRINSYKNGTWIHPILCIEKNGKIKVVDGNNRLKFIRSLMRYSPDVVAQNHFIYLMHKR
jgi:hypothetical protein